MHELLRQQIQRALELPDGEGVDTLLSGLERLDPNDLPEPARYLVLGFRRLIRGIDETYEQSHLAPIADLRSADGLRRLFETLVESIPDAITVKEADGLRYYLVNRAAEEMLGRSRAALLGRHAADVFGAESEASKSRERLAMAFPGSVQLGDEPLERPDREPRLLRTRRLAIHDGSGRPEYLVCIADDITEMRRAQEALQNEMDGRRQLDATVRAFTRTLRELQEVTATTDRSVDERVGDLLDIGISTFAADDGAVVVGEGPEPHVLYLRPGPDGAVTMRGRFVLERVRMTHPIHVEDQPIGSVVFRGARPRTSEDEDLLQLIARAIGAEMTRARTIERLAQAKDAAESANRAKGEFLATVSHEIRTPINAILGLSQAVLRRELPTEVRSLVDKIHGAGQGLLGLINDILDFSKIEAGKLELEHREFNFDNVVRQVCGSLCMSASEKGLEISIDGDMALPDTLLGDPLRLRQVLTNLMQNAIKFTKKGEVQLGTKLLERSTDSLLLKVWVTDTGIGLSDEEQARLFRPFSQADASTTRKYGGTGLGLAICRHLVEKMGGTIGVRSQLGEGSTFWFTVRLGFVGGSSATEFACYPDMRVLVVEDNPLARGAIARNLRQLGANAETVASLEAAQELLTQGKGEKGSEFDWVLFDGELSTTERHLELFHRVEALASSGRRSRRWAVLGCPMHIDPIYQEAKGLSIDVLEKPVTVRSLSALLSKLRACSPGRHPSAPPSPMEEAPELRGSRILLVEDNEVNQLVVKELLREYEVVLDRASTGEEALAWLDRHDVDVVLMDVQMPGMDGYETARRLRSGRRHAQVPIVALTANAMAGDAEKARAAGMNAHLAKPIDPTLLVRELVRWVQAGATQRGTASAVPPTPMGAQRESEPGGVDFASARERYPREAFLRRLFETFRASTESLATEMREAASTGDWVRVESLAHRMRGAAGNACARRLGLLGGQLEDACREGAVTRGPLVERFIEEAKCVDQALLEFLAL